MNQAQEFISSIFRPFKRSHSSTSTDNLHPDDRVEDGFLVVGDTRSERSTVLASEFNSSANVQSPPQYDQNNKNSDASGLPSYTEYCRSISSTIENGIEGSSQFLQTNVNHSNNIREDGELSGNFFNSISPVVDIPLVLNPTIQLIVDVESKVHEFDKSVVRSHLHTDFDYDFLLERNFLSI